MEFTMKKSLIISLSLFFVIGVAEKGFSQAAKVQFKAALERMEEKQFKKAILNLNKAIEADSMYPKAHEKRAECYTQIGIYENAMKDYRIALKRDPANPELKEQAAFCYLKGEDYSQAETWLNELLSGKKKKTSLLAARAECRVRNGNYNGALEDANVVADDEKKNYHIRYIRGAAYDSLKNTLMALTDYEKALSIYDKYDQSDISANRSFMRIYILAPMRLCMKNKEYDKALKFSEKGIIYSPTDAEMLWMRGKCYAGKMQAANAINEYSKAITLNDKNEDYFIDRGFAFIDGGKYEEALSDFSRALTLNGKAHRAYFGKAGVEAAQGLNKEAMQDYEKAMLIWPGNQTYKDAFAKAQAAYREKFRENDKPEIVIDRPYIKPEGTLVIPNDDRAFDIQGLIKDKSQIAEIKINDTPVDFDAGSLNPAFVFRMTAGNFQNLTITASDIYGNVNVSRYPVSRAETDAPFIKVDIPQPKGNVLTISDKKDYKMYLEGQIIDQSLIQSIRVNNVSASFNTKQKDPAFGVSLDVAGVENVEIVAKDENGNVNSVNYILNRSSNVEEEINPMGKTWVVFLENSNYQYLPSLEAVANDIALVKSSMTGYRIDSIITRKNLSKADMERFFSIELRNLVNKYGVASLMVWYSGHGKVTSDNGYWLPVDANKKDEYTYFPTTNLKGYLGSYKTVKHTLVVADATETGPAFYLAMRDVSPWKCGDWQATRLKSAQVLSSAEPERKNENSAFSKAFAQTLQTVPDKCVTIDHVSEKISTAIQRVQKQKPRFGNIQDLGDENGTFFFIKK